MAFDAHKNFAQSLVAAAPSPATSGTSLVVTTGEGSKFPAAPFNATIWPANAAPTTANAEIVRVTAVSSDTLTITRAQESSSARTIVVGDQIAATITAKTLTDVETATPLGIGWALKSYSTASAASSITVSSLDLTNDKHYRIIVSANGTTVASYNFTINGLSSSFTCGGTYQYFNGSTYTSPAEYDNMGSGVNLYLTGGNNMKSMFATIDAKLILVDGTNTKPVFQWDATTTGNGTSNDALQQFRAFGNNTGAVSNLTSITFAKASGTANWEVWILYPKTA